MGKIPCLFVGFSSRSFYVISDDEMAGSATGGGEMGCMITKCGVKPSIKSINL